MATSLAPSSLWSFVFLVFFVFSRGFWHFGSKTKKKLESKKQKKNSQTQWGHRVELFGFFGFGFLKPRENQKTKKKQNYQTQWGHRVELFGFFGFGFLKPRENQNKTTRPNGFIGLNFLVSLVFLVFLRLLLLWTENIKKMPDPWAQRVETVVVVFSRFLPLWAHNQKTSRQPKKQYRITGVVVSVKGICMYLRKHVIMENHFCWE